MGRTGVPASSSSDPAPQWEWGPWGRNGGRGLGGQHGGLDTLVSPTTPRNTKRCWKTSLVTLGTL